MTCGNDTLYAHSAALRNIELHNDVTSKTRGTEVNASSFYNNFGLYGYIYNSDQTWAANGSTLQPTINNEQITKGDTWTSLAYLPGKTKNMALFAYAPYTGIEVTCNQGAPQLTYTIASDVSNQVDLLVANNVDVVGNSSSVALDFNHALTAVKFAIGTITGFTKITNIVISGVKNSGTLSLYGENWNLNETTASYTIEKEIDLSTSGDITGSSNDLMLLMPQTLPSGAKLEVTMTNDIGTQTFSTDLTGGEWKKGYTVTYLLSVDRVAGEFHFEVTPSTTSIPKEGGDIELKVKSYYQIADGGAQVPIPWSGTYNIGSNQYTLSGDGSVNDDIRKISVPANNSTLTHTQTLQANPSKGTVDNPWNLSNSQGEAEVENTANCYVVNSKGTYSIPLVYGCAIKDGQPNAKSYNSTTFVNHAGDHITKPYIYEVVTNIDGAKLIWQDVNNMVTDIKLSSDKQSLIFTIGDNDNIAQGNAVVAATADGTVVWSWHIWVTNRDVSVTAAVPTKAFDTNYTYNFMPVPLGWCDDGTTSTVTPRNFTLSLTQEQSGKNLLASIFQAGSKATSGNFTYYQWGRKDPFVGSTGNICKTWYDENGKSKTSLLNSSSTRTKKYGITNPGYFIYGSFQWDTGAITYDDWNANINSDTGPSTIYNYDAVEKTVYDPSPVGYKLPPTKAFTGFAKADATGAQTANGSFSNGGWNFYTGGQSTGPTDFWITGGYRHYNDSGSLYGIGSNGNYWSAGPNSAAKGCDMTFYSKNVHPQSYDYRALGVSVRPVSE